MNKTFQLFLSIDIVHFLTMRSYKAAGIGTICIVLDTRSVFQLICILNTVEFPKFIRSENNINLINKKLGCLTVCVYFLINLHK